MIPGNEEERLRLKLKRALWNFVRKSRTSDVELYPKSENFGNMPVAAIETGIQPSRVTGIEQIDRAVLDCPDNLAFVQEQYAIGAKLDKKHSEGKLFTSSTMMKKITPSAFLRSLNLGDSEDEGTQRALSSTCAAVESPQGKKSASIAVRSPRSSSRIGLFKDGAKTSLGLVLEALCTNIIDLQQYGFSVLNANRLSMLAGVGNKPLQDGGYSVVIADLSLPLDGPNGKVYASTAGGDGNTPFTWSSAARNDIQGQIRGFWLALAMEKAGLIKGFSLGEDIWFDEAAGRLVKEKTDSCTPVLVLDLNMIKAGGKLSEEYLKAKAQAKAEGYAVPVKVDVKTRAWFIRELKQESHLRQTLACTFQEVIFWQAKGVKLESSSIVDNLRTELSRVSDKDREIIDNLIKDLGVDLTGLKAEGELPYRALLESMNNVLGRYASSGTQKTAKVNKVSGNQLVPCGWVVMAGEQLKYTAADEAKFVDGERNYSYADGTNYFGRFVAHRRTPQLTPWCLSVSRAISLGDLLQLASDLKEDKTSDKYRLASNRVQKIMEWHNGRARDMDYEKEGSAWGCIETLESMTKRVIMLARSLESSNLVNVAKVNPLDGKARNEDHDGDDTSCDVSLHWCALYYANSCHWRRLKAFSNELPKETAMQWNNESLRQLLPDPEGKMEIVTNVKGATLYELFPTPDHCTFERLTLVHKVTLAEMQGPTGLASNAAADAFARVVFVESSDPADVNWRGERLLVPSKGTEKIYKLWVVLCLIVQLSIDWQKRAYLLFLLGEWERLAELVIAAGTRGLQSFDGQIPLATRESEYLGKKLLGENFCFNPELIYPFAEGVLKEVYHKHVKICMWKPKRDRFTFTATSSEVMEDLEARFNPASRFYNVVKAAHEKGGWISKFGLVRDYSEKMGANIKSTSVADDELVALIPYAFRYVAHQAMVVGDAGDLDKVNASYRGRLFLRGLGVRSDEIDNLVAGKAAVLKTPNGTEKSVFFKDLVAAACHGAAGREVDGFEILVSWWVHEKGVEETEKKAIAVGHQMQAEVLSAIALSPKLGDLKERGIGVVTTNTWERSFVPPTKMCLLWEEIVDCLEGSQSWIWNVAIPRAVEAVSELEPSKREQLAKIVLSPVISILKTAKLLAGRRGVFQLSRPASQQISTVLMSGERFKKIAQAQGVKFNQQYKKKEFFGADGKSVGSWHSTKSEYDGDHTSNHCSTWWWLSLLGSTDPVRMATNALKKNYPFSAPPERVELAFNVRRMLKENKDLIVKSRTLTGAGGWITHEIFEEAVTACYQMYGSWPNEHGTWVPGYMQGHPMSGLNVVRSTMSSTVLPTYNEDSEYYRNDTLHEFLVEGEPLPWGKLETVNGERVPVKRTPCMKVDESLHAFLKAYGGGVTPIPYNFKIKSGNTLYEGGQAVQKLVISILENLCLGAMESMAINTPKSLAYAEYENAKEWWETICEKYSLYLTTVDGVPLEPKSLYRFSPLVWQNLTGEDRYKKRAAVVSMRKKVAALASAYANLGV